MDCEAGQAQELAELFTFEAKGAKYHPLVRNRVWDGKIRLFNPRTRLLYRGLSGLLHEYCKREQYEYDPEACCVHTEYSLKEFRDWVPKLKLPYEVRDYQEETVVHCVRNGRALFVSPTGSGKSLMIYMLLRHYAKKTLIIIDSIGLLKQMTNDFKKYGFDTDRFLHPIFAKQEKQSSKPVFITTWQSAVKQPKEWFDQFEVVIGDEAHTYDAKSCKTIMENLTKANYRFGFTGTLDPTDCKTSQMVLEGLFGPYKKIVSTKELQEQGYLAPLEIKSLVLHYPPEVRKQQKGATYEEEISFLFAHAGRNRFIKNLALSLKGNTLLLFRRIETHGVPLFDMIKAEASVPTYYVSGKVEGDDREAIRQIVNTHETSITVASVGTFAKGIDIPKLHNIIFASPSKAYNQTLQAIGRGLRPDDSKYKATLFDIADDLSWKTWKNYTLKHHAERIKMYVMENFDYKLYPVELK